MTTLSLLHGFIGSGKTTFSRRLADATGAIRLNADEWIGQHFSKDDIDTSDWNILYAQAMADIDKTTKSLIAAGQNVILDLGFWSYTSRAKARDSARQWGITLDHYYFDTPKDIILSRIANRHGVIAQKNIENFDRLFLTFEPPRPDEHIIRITPENQP